MVEHGRRVRDREGQEEVGMERKRKQLQKRRRNHSGFVKKQNAELLPGIEDSGRTLEIQVGARK